MSPIRWRVTLQVPFEQAVEQVTAALKEEGFGVLPILDVRETLKQKLGMAFRPYRILGACNPPLAHRALESDPRVGLRLSWNVVVEGLDEHTGRVTFLNPEAAITVGDLGTTPVLREVAATAQGKLRRVAQNLSTLKEV